MEDARLADTARRVNRARLADFVNERVRFVGEVSSVSGSTVTLESPDGGEVKCVLTSDPPSCKYIEVTALVQPDLTLQQVDFLQDLGNSLNMGLVNDGINLSFHPQLRQLFKTDQAAV
eukprot:Selendium_serpulae@DN4925_c0_g1_i1.p1